MKFEINFKNIHAEFEAETKEDVYKAQKLFKCAAYTFRDDEIQSSLNHYKAIDKTVEEPETNEQQRPNVQIDPNEPATQRQLMCLDAHHVKYDPNITKVQAYKLIKDTIRK